MKNNHNKKEIFMLWETPDLSEFKSGLGRCFTFYYIIREKPER